MQLQPRVARPRKRTRAFLYIGIDCGHCQGAVGGLCLWVDDVHGGAIAADQAQGKAGGCYAAVEPDVAARGVRVEARILGQGGKVAVVAVGQRVWARRS